MNRSLTRNKINNYLRKYPNAPPKEVARMFHVTPTTVARLKKEREKLQHERDRAMAEDATNKNVDFEYENTAAMTNNTDLDKGGVKYDTGKLPWHLLPGDALEEVVKVLQFGAKKYTRTVENEWHALLLAPNVKHVTITTPTGSAVRVMSGSSGEPILSMLNVSAKTAVDGGSKTQTVCENWQSVGEMILHHVSGTAAPSGSSSSEAMGSPKRGTKSSALPDAQSAGKSNTCTLTIAIAQDAFAASCAPDAITASGFWTTVWRGLSERYGISKPQSRTGERNWEVGMKWSRCFGACMRHMWAYWKGEDNDPETGLSHLAHAMCCVMFLLSYHLRKVGTDDRPIGFQYASTKMPKDEDDETVCEGATE